jgi:hypothetical protein
MECPKCHSEIGRAKQCGCGWRKEARLFSQEDTKPCGFEPCPISSKMKIKTKTGWLNVCERHYHEYHRRQAVAYCEAMGLDTVEKQREWVKKNARGLMKRYTQNIPATREPGQDDEERETA